jgi:quercetin dioxygenase-like cupin family protein
MSTVTKELGGGGGHILGRIDAFARRYRYRVAFTAALCVISVPAVFAGPEAAKELAKQPGVILARELLDVPGKNLVVVALEFPPKSDEKSKSPQQYIGHRHPGSTYVYVIKGSLRLGIEGQPVQLVHSGESFFEPLGALHTIAENASATKPASAIAVLIVPDGAPILTEIEGPKK